MESKGIITAEEDDDVSGLQTPWGVARNLGIDPYDWQVNVMADVFPIGSRVALRAANGSGKTTSVVSSLVLWHAMSFKNSITVLTSGAWRQVKEQLFPAIQKHQDKLPGWTINANDFVAPNGSRCVGFSTDDPGKFEGWHNSFSF